MKKVFKYPVAYRCESYLEQKHLFEALEKLGYSRHCVDDFDNNGGFKYVGTNYDYDCDRASNYNDSSYNACSRFLCDSKELFLALAAMTKDEEFFEGEYVIRIEDSHCGMKVGDIDRITKVNYQDSIILTRYSPGLTGGHLGKNLRKATKEEIISFIKIKTEIKFQEENQMKKLIGYKLIKPEYEKVVVSSLHLFSVHKPNIIIAGMLGYYEPKIKELGIMDWFEPVYEEVIPEYIKYLGNTDKYSYVLKNAVYKVNKYHNKNEIDFTDSMRKDNTTWLSNNMVPATKEEYEAYQEYIKPKLIEGKWYTNDLNTSLVNYQGNNLGYGFHMKMWASDWSISDIKLWRLASESEVKSALISEGKKKGLTPGTKFNSAYKDCPSKGVIVKHESLWEYRLNSDTLSDGNYLYSKGKWAEVVSSIPDYKVGDYVEYVTTNGDGSGSYSEIGIKTQCIRIDGLAWNSKYTGLPDDLTDFYSDNLGLNLSFEGIKRKVTKDEYIKSVIPDIEINGYKAKFGKDIVGFGCNDIQVDFIQEIYRLQSIGIDLTKESSKIKQIADYYKNK